LSWGLFSL